SPSPIRRKNRRAPSTPRHQSSSPVRRKITNPGQQKSSSLISMSSSPSSRISLSPKCDTPPSMLRRGKSANRDHHQNLLEMGTDFSGNLPPPPPLLKGKKVPALSPSPYNSFLSSVSPPAARRTPSKERSPIPRTRQRETMNSKDRVDHVELEEKDFSKPRKDRLQMQTRSGSFDFALRKLIIKKHKRWKRKDVSLDDDDIHDSHIKDRKEAKRRHKEEKKLKKEEKRKRREERRHKKDSRRTAKLKLKAGRDVSPSLDLDKSHDSREEALSDPKKLEIELLEKAFESLRAKKGVGHILSSKREWVPENRCKVNGINREAVKLTKALPTVQMQTRSGSFDFALRKLIIKKAQKVEKERWLIRR
nr:hypothetical protein [Tanacetum cinerariifolium]